MNVSKIERLCCIFFTLIGAATAATCPSGYESTSSGCKDIDECAKKTAKCHKTWGICTNTQGGYKCRCQWGSHGNGVECYEGKCAGGYNYNPATYKCDDIDECKASKNPCGANSVCQNKSGGYLCACQSGFQLSNKQCIKITTAQGATTTKFVTQMATTTVTATKTQTLTMGGGTQSQTTSSLLPTDVTTTTETTQSDASRDELCDGLVDADGKRVRKEWRELSQVQKDNYIDAVREVWSRGYWTNAVWYHQQPGNDEMVHGSNHFLYWHRFFVYNYENLLRLMGWKFSCVTVPFWDWTMDVKEDPMQVPNISVVEDLGGVVSEGCLDFFGPVRFGEDGERCITRPMQSQRGWRPPGPIEVANGIIAFDTFNDMSNIFKGWHALIHSRTGGTMADNLYSGNDPIFFLHHAMLDKIFSTWQACHNADQDPGATVPNTIYEPNPAVATPHSFDDELTVYPLKDIHATPRQLNSIAKLGYSYSVDKIEQGSSWAPLGECHYRVPWYEKQWRRSAGFGNDTEEAESGQNSTQPIEKLFGNRTTTEGKEMYNVAKTAEEIYDVASKVLNTSDNVAVLDLAKNIECEKFQDYGIVDGGWADILKITDVKLPCHNAKQKNLV